jgi:hypothetical protein
MQEFRRLDSQLGAARDRAELLAGGAENLPLLSVQVQSSTGTLLRERATLNTSVNYVSCCQGWVMGGTGRACAAAAAAAAVVAAGTAASMMMHGHGSTTAGRCCCSKQV